MTIKELVRQCSGYNPDTEVLVRLDPEAMDDSSGTVFAILGVDFSYGCTDTYRLMLDCGQGDESEDATE